MMMKGNSSFKWVSVLLIGLACRGYGETNNLYVTCAPIEPDKCISAWLLKTHVNTNAMFLFFKKGEPPPAGTLFDVPGSPYLRDHKIVLRVKRVF